MVDKHVYLYKFVRACRRADHESGFTLVELLVVIIIIGILAAIALPSFLSQANKARLSEAQTYIGSINKAQQSHYTERNTFAVSSDALELGIPPETNSYNYIISGSANEAVSGADPKSESLAGVSGRVFIPTGKSSFTSIICVGTPGSYPSMVGVNSEDNCP